MCVNHYCLYCNISVFFKIIENIKTGLRVVERLKKPENAVLGTIISVSESGKEVEVLWDNSIDGKAYSYSTGKDNNFHLLLFDNAQTGKFT